MILKRGDVVLEFFPHPEVDPLTSWFSCCIRLDDVDEFYAACVNANIVESCKGAPRIHRPRVDANGLRIGALIRIIQNEQRG